MPCRHVVPYKHTGLSHVRVLRILFTDCVHGLVNMVYPVDTIQHLGDLG
jgi:hypothetical protein